MRNINIRKAEAADMNAVHQLIVDLAVYEKAKHEVKTSVETMKVDGFEKNLFEVLLAEDTEGNALGIALYYYAYSTWKGKMIYLDDLVVNEVYRKQGVGKLLFDELVKTALSNNVNQVRWHVLDWNVPAINFYNKIKANLDHEWIQCKFERADLENYQLPK